MNLTKKQIDLIIRYTPKSLKGKSASPWTILGYFTPSGANWSYCAGWIQCGGHFVLVVTRFGIIV